MKKIKPKAALKKGEAKAKKKAGFTISAQEKACAEVVGDLWEMIEDDDGDGVNWGDVEACMKNRGVSKEFLREIINRRAIEEMSRRDKAIASLKAAYNKLPKHLKEILDNMDSDDMCEAICNGES